MRKKIKGSLFAKVFLITAAMLLCTALSVFALLAFLMPKTYSNRLNAALDAQAENFISELEQAAFSESGGLFDQFLQNTEIDAVALYNSSGKQVPLPTEEFYGGEEAVAEQSYAEESGENVPVLANSYYFSFAGSSQRYMMVVSGRAEQIAQLRQSFQRILPLLIFLAILLSFAMSWLYSHMITKPVLELSQVAAQMSGLHFQWKVDEGRTDELGTLGKSLNKLSCNLSATLADLQSAKEKLEADMEREKQMEQERTDFFSAVSHELKTPVTVIKGQLEGMLLGIGIYKNHEKYLARSLEVANTLETMVQEILTIARLGTSGGDFRKDHFDCIPMIQSYLDETEDLAAKKELKIHPALPSSAVLYGSRLLLEKVFSNLIGNAILYSPPGASVWISVDIQQGQMEFSVENEGAHIEESDISKLFGPFYRVEQSRSRETGGTGLGLYIVQEVLRKHGSACRVCNTQRGVEFAFCIPEVQGG